jgi:hypothetical protein
VKKRSLVLLTCLVLLFASPVYADHEEGHISEDQETTQENVNEGLKPVSPDKVVPDSEKKKTVSNSPANKDKFEKEVQTVSVNPLDKKQGEYLASQKITLDKTQLVVYGILALFTLVLLTRIVVANIMGRKFVLVQSHNYLQLKRIKKIDDMIRTKDGMSYLKQDVKFLRIPWLRAVEVYCYDVTLEEVTLRKYQRAIEADFTKAMSKDGLSMTEMIVVTVCILTVVGLGFVYFKIDTLFQLLGVK